VEAAEDEELEAEKILWDRLDQPAGKETRETSKFRDEAALGYRQECFRTLDRGE